MEYDIVSSDSDATLVAAIHQMFENGWQLAGGVTVSVTHGKRMFHQALVRKS